MASFQTKNPNLGKFWRALDWKLLIYFMAIWNILQTFGIFYNHLAHFVLIWYIFFRFGYHEGTKKNLATLILGPAIVTGRPPRPPLLFRPPEAAQDPRDSS
jgi:hypothetical protein